MPASATAANGTERYCGNQSDYRRCTISDRYSGSSLSGSLRTHRVSSLFNSQAADRRAAASPLLLAIHKPSVPLQEQYWLYRALTSKH
jgi:hypothetical protein